MPELPEVETVMRGLTPAMQGARISHLSLSDKSLRFPYNEGFQQSLIGTSIERLSRRGKYIQISLSNDFELILHLGMSGSFRIEPTNAKTTIAHDHLVFTLNNGKSITYNDPRRFGFAETVLKPSAQNYRPFTLMGPEPLSTDFNATYLYDTLKSITAPIKQALLNQAIVAGLGNIYVCEALYRAGIHPKRKANAISKKRINTLVPHIKDILEEAIASGGSSLKDHKGVDGTMGYFQHHFDVYGREGEICRHHTCQQKNTACIKRITQSGRSTFYCRNTQK